MLSESNRRDATDKKFDSNVTDCKFLNYLFVRLVAKKRHFTNVDFRFSIFDTCYLRDCTFDSCDFTGCRFVGTNLHGSCFSGCKFDYANFERTIVDSGILASECSPHENLKMRFARTLRMNFQQIGDAKAVNIAIGVELQATGIHLHKCWNSSESYYRKKYMKWKRVRVFLEWLEFKVLDFTWGNGESTVKLLRAITVLLALVTINDALVFRDPVLLKSYAEAMVEAPQIFVGTLVPTHYSAAYLTTIVFFRLVTFGFLMSIIIKRFNRR